MGTSENKFIAVVSRILADDYYFDGSEKIAVELVIGNLVAMARFLGIDMDSKSWPAEYIKRLASRDEVKVVKNK